MTYKELQYRLAGFSSEQLDMEAIVYVNDAQAFFSLEETEILNQHYPIVEDGTLKTGQPILTISGIGEGL